MVRAMAPSRTLTPASIRVSQPSATRVPRTAAACWCCALLTQRPSRNAHAMPPPKVWEQLRMWVSLKSGVLAELGVSAAARTSWSWRARP